MFKINQRKKDDYFKSNSRFPKDYFSILPLITKPVKTVKTVKRVKIFATCYQ